MSRNFNWPATISSSGPIQFNLNGVTTVVSEDTGTPANSRPLPVTILSGGGANLDTNYGAVGANTLRTAAEIGNATGAANFNSGATGAQTLRVEANQGAANATPWNVSAAQSGTWNINNISGTISLPTGAATSALQTALSAQIPTTLGQKTMANSLAVAIASDQSAVPVSGTVAISGTVAATQSGTWTVQPGNTANSTPWLVTVSTALPAGGNTIGNVGVIAGSAIIGKVGIDQTTPGTTNGVQINAALPAGANVIGALTANQSVNVAQINGVTPLMGSGNTGTGSQRVTIASDQAAIATKSPVNTNGSIVNTALTATTASTANVPANAVGFILEAPSSNTDNIRYCIGGTASTTVGMLMEPGRDTGYVPCAANISVCATVSGTDAFSIQWILSS